MSVETVYKFITKNKLKNFQTLISLNFILVYAKNIKIIMVFYKLFQVKAEFWKVLKYKSF